MTIPKKLSSSELIRQIADRGDRKAAWQFFLFFSRFEYALKRGAYLSQGSKQATPDWDKFASDHNDVFELLVDQRLADAILYFRVSPPRKQVRKDRRLSWSDPYVYTNGPLLVWLLTAIRIVRNNLFHGGKFPGIPFHDPSRNSELIENAIVILSHALALNADIEGLFGEGTEL
ncbi:hypothetical protein [Longimicrobium terrae]|uniref:Apea-like HEPN domain-containing protein n=1 Tax=Longimicrobium terrae TaxID=1639882 RepID=A0A841GJG4_9BACT|nr:hypothetical protein [Longimicrobium terrae]MBB4634279.1 hypothetical protein [Longimicrobium terrae]MBB6068831.1 hypothetical protein [Longimicrobium terrae]NNC28013.1 hypothetical protein [Longimicrobium terrae]